MFNIFFFRKSCRVWDNAEKYGGDGQDADDNIVLRREDTIFLQDNYGKNTDPH